MKSLLGIACVGLLVLAACSSPDETPGTDAGVNDDLGAADMGATDSGPRDMGTPDLGRDAGPSCTEGCGIVEIAAGFWHTCARRENGQVLCWGDNLWSELGDGSGRHMTCPPVHEGIPTDCSVNPVPVTGFDDAQKLAVRRSINSCAQHTDATWQCWGVSFIPAVGMPTQNASPVSYAALVGDISEIANTGDFACVLLTDGTVKCVGENDSGQLGDETRMQRTALVETGIDNAFSVDVGSNHACALLNDGSVQCWGSNSAGQLGNTEEHSTCGSGAQMYDCALTPVAVSGIDGIVQVTTGASHTCALRADGTVWCWGSNAYGAIGSGEEADAPTPVEVLDLPEITQIAAGDNNECALDTEGVIHCWGANQRKTLGDGAASHSVCSVDANDCSRVPVTVATIDDATAITIGGAHACAIREDQSVWCWGYNVNYQTGVAPNDDVATPTQVSSLAL